MLESVAEGRAMKIIDAHNHIDFHGITVDRAIADMDRHGIDQAWLLTWEVPASEIDFDLFRKAIHPSFRSLTFERVYEAFKNYPDRFIVGYCPDPRDPQAIEKLEQAYHHYDVKVCGELKLRMMYDNPDAIELYETCGELGLPVVTHIDYPIRLRPGHYPRSSYWYGGGVEALERVLRQVPQTNFLGHAPGFWAHISDDGQHAAEIYPKGPIVGKGAVIRLLETYDNIYADLSAFSALNALSRDIGFTKELFDRFQDRFVFARDCYTTELYDFINGLDLPLSIREKIFYKNARSLIRSV